MPIPVSCSCGRRFAAPDRLAGKTVKCPECAQPLKIPAAQPAASQGNGEKITAACSCGAAFAVGSHLAGKTIKCPKCQQPFKIPDQAAAPAAAQARQSAPAGAAASSGAPKSSLDDLFDELGVKEKATGENACPSCSEALSPEAVICVNCGFDRRSGKKIGTEKVRKVPTKSLDAPIRGPAKGKAKSGSSYSSNPYIAVWQRAGDFEGRSSRWEYWMFTLINNVIAVGLMFVDMILVQQLGFGMLGLIYGLLVIVPALAVSIRRLHDTNKSGLWLLVAFVPCVSVILLVFFVQPSDRGTNDYGPNPYGK